MAGAWRDTRALLRERSFWLLLAAMALTAALVLWLVPTPYHFPVSALLLYLMTDRYQARWSRRG